MDSEIVSVNFSLCYIKIHWYVLHFEWIFYTCIGLLEKYQLTEL